MAEAIMDVLWLAGVSQHRDTWNINKGNTQETGNTKDCWKRKKTEIKKELCELYKWTISCGIREG